MIKRSFKPAQCKTALRMASSRIKLLKNKKEAQVRQLKRELAQLLAAGNDPTARIRVEHVVREQKMLAAYELIEIYSELILARMPMIESQKKCPIDMQEAVASILYASPRCADVPELMDVRKHFTNKYGKDFVTGAVDLHPDCGVSRLMVEKLAPKGPDGPTKIKILTAIAEEHNVKWEPKSFGESDAKHAEDLLNGATTFQQATTIHAHAHNAEEPPNSVVKGPINERVSSKNYEKNDPGSNSYIPHSRSSSYSQTPTGGDARISDTHLTMSSLEFQNSHTEDGTGFASDRKSWNMEFKDATAAAQAAAESAERASMAARAAAELSNQERISRQHTTESPKASASASRDEEPQYHTGSRLHGEPFTQHTTSNPSVKRYSETPQELLTDDELLERFYNLRKFNNNSDQSTSPNPSSASVVDHLEVNNLRTADTHSQKGSPELEKRNSLHEAGLKKKPIGSGVDTASEVDDGMKFETDDYLKRASVRKQSSNVFSRSHSQTSSGDNDTLSYKTVQEVNDLPMADGHFQTGLPELEKRNSLHEASSKKTSIATEIDIASEVEDRLRFETDGNLERGSIRKQSSNVSSPSHSQTFSGDFNVFSNEKILEPDEHPFVFDGRTARDDLETTCDNADVIFDGSGSDDDGAVFDLLNDDKEASNSYFLPGGMKSPTHDTHAWSPGTKTDVSYGESSSQLHFTPEKHPTSIFSEGLTSGMTPSQQDHLSPVAFDESEGPSSESEEEQDKSPVIQRTSTDVFPHDGNTYFRDPEPIQSENPHPVRSQLVKEESLGSNSKTWLKPSSPDLDAAVVHSQREQEGGATPKTGRRFGHRDLYTSQSSLKTVTSESNSNDYKDNLLRTEVSSVEDDVWRHELPVSGKDAEESSLDTGKMLNFGALTGGLKSKGYRVPPYRQRTSGKLSMSTQDEENTSSRIDKSSSSHMLGIKSVTDDWETSNEIETPRSNRKTSSRTPTAYFDSDDADEEHPQQNFSSSQESYTRKPIELYKKSSLENYFGSNSSDAEDESSEKTSTVQTSPVVGISRRTRGSPASRKHSYSKATVASGSPTSADYVAETQRKPQSLTNSSDYEGTFHQRKPAEQPSSKVMPNSKRDSNEQLSSRNSYLIDSRPNLSDLRSSSSDSRENSEQATLEHAAPKPSSEPKRSLGGSPREQPPASRPHVTAALGTTESLKISSSRGETPSRENSEQTRFQQAAFKPSPEPKRSLYESPRSSPRRQPPASRPHVTAALGTTESLRVSSSRGEAPSRENSLEQAALKPSPEPKRSLYESLKSSPREQPPASRRHVTAALGTAVSSKVASAHSEAPSWENSEHARSQHAASKPSPEPKRFLHDSWSPREQPPARLQQAASKPSPEPKRSLHESPKSSPRQQPPASRPHVTAALGTAESSKVLSARSEAPSRENSEQARSQHAASKPSPEPKRSLHESPKSSPRKQPPASHPPVTAAASGTAESSNVSSAPREPPSRENSIDRASHVHPKLPDYDSLAARIRELTEDRK